MQIYLVGDILKEEPPDENAKLHWQALAEAVASFAREYDLTIVSDVYGVTPVAIKYWTEETKRRHIRYVLETCGDLAKSNWLAISGFEIFPYLLPPACANDDDLRLLTTLYSLLEDAISKASDDIRKAAISVLPDFIRNAVNLNSELSREKTESFIALLRSNLNHRYSGVKDAATKVLEEISPDPIKHSNKVKSYRKSLPCSSPDSDKVKRDELLLWFRQKGSRLLAIKGTFDFTNETSSFSDSVKRIFTNNLEWSSPPYEAQVRLSRWWRRHQCLVKNEQPNNKQDLDDAKNRSLYVKRIDNKK